MVVYEYYKPSCLEFNISDLENFQLSGDIDFFELLDNNSKIVFYYRGMKENQKRKFKFSMFKRYSLVECVERTDEVYLYYDKKGSVVYV